MDRISSAGNANQMCGVSSFLAIHSDPFVAIHVKLLLKTHHESISLPRTPFATSRPMIADI